MAKTKTSGPNKTEEQNAEIIEAIEELRKEIKSTLGPEESRRLNASLGQLLSRARKDAYRDQAVAKAVQRIDEYPQIRGRFSELLDGNAKWYDKPTGSQYFSVAGDLFDLEPGQLMVCPLDPSHYQRYRRNARQKLTCPHHDVELVPVEHETS